MAVCWFTCDGTGFSLKMAKVTVPSPLGVDYLPPFFVHGRGGNGGMCTHHVKSEEHRENGGETYQTTFSEMSEEQ